MRSVYSPKESGYYPPGAEYSSDAPWNEVEPDPIKLPVSVCYCMSKSCNIAVYNYKVTGIEEGLPVTDLSDTNLNEEYESDGGVFNIPELLQILIKDKTDELNRVNSITPKTIEEKKSLRRKAIRLSNIIESAKGWTVDDLTVIEE